MAISYLILLIVLSSVFALKHSHKTLVKTQTQYDDSNYTPDPTCIQYFKYHGVQYAGCTSVNGNKPWCLDANGDLKYCTEKGFIRDPACKTTFIFKGTTYVGCTSVDGDKPWCSLDDVYISGSGRFKYCTKQGYFADPACKAVFTFKGSRYSGCTSVDGFKPWCSLDDEYISGSGRFKFCTPQGYIPDRLCKASFFFEGVKYTGCTSADGDKPWCSLDDNYISGSGRFKYCTEEGWFPDKACVKTFFFQGSIYDGCTQADGDAIPWCSPDLLYIKGSGRFKTCGRSAQGIPDSQCLDSFTYKGVKYIGCSLVDDNKPWCSLIDPYVSGTGMWRYCKI